MENLMELQTENDMEAGMIPGLTALELGGCGC